MLEHKGICWKEKIDTLCDCVPQKYREQIAQEIEVELCNNGISCYGVNQEHCDTVKELAAIARGQK